MASRRLQIKKLNYTFFLYAMLTYVVQKFGEFQQKGGHITNRHGTCSPHKIHLYNSKFAGSLPQGV